MSWQAEDKRQGLEVVMQIYNKVSSRLHNDESWVTWQAEDKRQGLEVVMQIYNKVSSRLHNDESWVTWQAEDKRQGLEVVMQIYNAVERLQSMKLPGMASDVDEKGNSAEDKALKGAPLLVTALSQCWVRMLFRLRHL